KMKGAGRKGGGCGRDVASGWDFIGERARGHFVKAKEIMTSCPRQVVRAPRVMGAVYRQKLEDMVSRGWAPPRHRVHVKKSYLLWIALRHAFVFRRHNTH